MLQVNWLTWEFDAHQAHPTVRMQSPQVSWIPHDSCPSTVCAMCVCGRVSMCHWHACYMCGKCTCIASRLLALPSPLFHMGAFSLRKNQEGNTSGRGMRVCMYMYVCVCVMCDVWCVMYDRWKECILMYRQHDICIAERTLRHINFVCIVIVVTERWLFCRVGSIKFCICTASCGKLYSCSSQVLAVNTHFLCSKRTNG